MVDASLYQRRHSAIKAISSYNIRSMSRCLASMNHSLHYTHSLLRHNLCCVIQGDTKKDGHHQNSNNFQSFIYIDTKFQQHLVTSCVADNLKISSLYYKTSLFHWRSKNVLEMSSPALQALLDPAGKIFDDPTSFLPRDRFYCCCDCCLQVRDTLGVVRIDPVLKVSPQIKIWGVQVR